MDDTISAAPRWVVVTTQVLSIVGLGIAAYLTAVHFIGVSALVCSKNSVFNCEAVTTSAESRFLGIPVAILGLAQYAVMTALCTPWAWRAARREVHLARFALATIGMCFVLWLIYAELVLVKNVCLWCSGVHIVTFSIFVCCIAVTPRMLGWSER